MSTSPMLIALDSVSIAVNVAVRFQELVQKAQMEGRDNLTLDELKSIMSENDALEDRILNTP